MSKSISSKTIMCPHCGGNTRRTGNAYNKRWCTNCYRFIKKEDCIYTQQSVKTLLLVKTEPRKKRYHKLNWTNNIKQ